MYTGLSSLMDTAVAEADSTADNEESEEKQQEKELQYLKTALKLYKATRISLEAVSEKMRSAFQFPDHLSTGEVMELKVQDLHNDITLLKSLDDVSKLIHENYVFADVMNSHSNEHKEQMERTSDEIAYFSKSILSLYENECEPLDVIEKGKTYIVALELFKDHLEKLKSESGQAADNADDAKLAKCKSMIEKINVIRALKSILIGNFANGRYPEIEKLRCSSRRNMELEDFEETWNVGFK